MTQFKQIEIFYENFLKLEKQINNLIKNEDYEAVPLMIMDRNKFIKQIYRAQKTVDFTPEEADIIKKRDEMISKQTKELIEKLKEKHIDLAKELKITKGKVKISSAYTPLKKNKIGNLIDTSE